MRDEIGNNTVNQSETKILSMYLIDTPVKIIDSTEITFSSLNLNLVYCSRQISIGIQFE